MSALVLLPSPFCVAQVQTNQWRFGVNESIDFNTGVPVSLSGSILNTTEGSASIADDAGNLLFYTDGITVWNQNNNGMVNGFGLFGGYSSSQSALIVPMPLSDSLYYIFTTGEQLAYGLYYSIVDMSLQGGLGEVIVKNVLLDNQSCEKITAICHANGQDKWIVAHDWGNNTFQAYLLSDAGVDATPVTSSTGQTMTGNSGNTIGYLKGSPDGSKLALAVWTDNFFEMFDFDKSTGIVSHNILLASYNQASSGAYGVEFSPDGTRLYGTVITPGYLYQWDLTAGSDSLIQASKTLAGTASVNFNGALQLATDGKIYMAQYNSSWLGVINDPNVLGAGCNFDDTGFQLLFGMNGIGLPNMYYCSAFSLFPQVENICLGDSTHLFIYNSNADSLVSWDFGDPASGAANTDTGASVHHVFTATDSFLVTLIQYLYGGTADTIYINVLISTLPVIALGNDTTVCIGDTLTLDAGNAGAGYSWSNGSTAQTIAVTDSGTYSVIVSNAGCKNTGSINVSFIDCSQLPHPGLFVPDPTICEKFCMDFTDQSTNNPTAWLWIFEGGNPSTSTLQNPTQICYNLPGTYDVTLTASNALGSLTQTFPNYITVYATPPAPQINQSGYTLYSSFATSYQWQFNSVDIPGAIYQSYTVTQSGYYTVVVYDSHGCFNYTSVYILISGVDDVGGDEHVFITPNPSDGSFMVELLNGFMAEKIFVEVTNDLGQIVFSSENKMSFPGWKTQIDLSDVARGVYFIEIKTEHEFVRKKILIAN